jgi:hypothetical protein
VISPLLVRDDEKIIRLFLWHRYSKNFEQKTGRE